MLGESPKATAVRRWNRRRRSAASANRTTSPGSPCSTPPTTRAGSPARRSSLPAASGNNSLEPVASGLEHHLEDRFMSSALFTDLLGVLDELSGGVHPGFRPAHAKGLMCAGTFTPSRQAAELTRAPHAARPSTPVTVRYSDSTGIPTISDNDPARSGPPGIAVRFHLADHVHTDIVAHSTNGFPVRTGEEFLEFLRAAAAAGAGHPEEMGAFLAMHPNAARFVQAPKPIPTSFAPEAFFAVTALKFTNADG